MIYLQSMAVCAGTITTTTTTTTVLVTVVRVTMCRYKLASTVNWLGAELPEFYFWQTEDNSLRHSVQSDTLPVFKPKGSLSPLQRRRWSELINPIHAASKLRMREAACLLPTSYTSCMCGAWTHGQIGLCLSSQLNTLLTTSWAGTASSA
jgi:hypothetical protein